MEKKTEKKFRTILSSMEDIVAKAKEHKLEEKFFEEAKDSLKYVSKVLLMNQEQAMTLSLFFEKSWSSRIRLSDIAEMIEVSNLKIISMMNVADELAKNGYLKCYEIKGECRYYSVPVEVIDSIRRNVCFIPKPISGLSIDDFFDRLAKIFEEDDVLRYRREESIDELVKGNMHLPYCKIISSYLLDSTDELLLHIFAHRLINEDDDMIGTHDWEDFIDSNREVKQIQKSLKRGSSILVNKGILEACFEDGIKNPDYFHLTDHAKEELFPGMDLVDKAATLSKDLISYTSFSKKQLFYAPHIQSQINRLAELLQQDKFIQVTQRLSENGMRKGFACLFYGSPGTGKTETVNQLARMSGRDVMMVDVTKIKSCWVGESEQNIKRLFDRYRSYVKTKDVAPILLFNEADAVLGIRQEGAQRAVDKMENSIQNIILQEMETLEGIMIATTNLTNNLDKAFERRFIYKIEFERPTVEAKQQIWKSMIPVLSDEATMSLANDYDLSGGQIENIARKRTIELILSGSEPSYTKIREYCQSESIDSKEQKRKKIGF